MESSLNVQVGGDHYSKMKIQPVQLISKLDARFIQGCVIKYISRYKNKNGKQDLEKCIHFSKIAIELEDIESCSGPQSNAQIAEFCMVNEMSGEQMLVIHSAVEGDYENVIVVCEKLIAEEYS